MSQTRAGGFHCCDLQYNSVGVAELLNPKSELRFSLVVQESTNFLEAQPVKCLQYLAIATFHLTITRNSSIIGEKNLQNLN